MMTPEDELQDRKGVSDVPRPCRNCGHSEIAHINEIGDDVPCCGEEMTPCGCMNYEPQTAEDILDRESRI
jgi:hypothetical protein